MGITEVGTLPVSAINIGLAASVAGFTEGVTKLQADLADVGVALVAQGAFSATFPPSLVDYAALFVLSLDPVVLAASFDPANWITGNADAHADLVVELGIIEAHIEVVETIVLDLHTGLDAGALAGWTYSGTARGFGTSLEAATAGGFGGVDPSTEISAIIIATAGFSAWGSFSDGFETGTSDADDLGATTTQVKLQSLGVLNGGQWNTGVAEVVLPLDLFLADLEGIKAAIDAQLELMIGLNLPDPVAVVDVGLSVDLDAALENIVNVQTDLDVQVDGIQLKIDALLDLIVDINAGLSAAGLTVWSYSGPAGDLGAAFAPEVKGGLPGIGQARAPAYGIVIATASPSAWVDFGKICITG